MMPKKWAVALYDTPVYNTQDIKSLFEIKNGRLVALDEKGLLRELEMIAPVGTRFEVVEDLGEDVLKIRTQAYEYEKEFFVDARLVSQLFFEPKPKPVYMPTKEEILANLKNIAKEDKKKNIAYVWGGNVRAGLLHLKEFYPRKEKLKNYDANYYIYKGLDCSGMLYEASFGFTPRNTSELVEFGQGLEIEGKNVTEVAAMLAPLDLIVWPGHVLIVLSKTEIIESSLEAKGVQVSDLKKRLSEVMNKFLGVSEISGTGQFTIRRFM